MDVDFSSVNFGGSLLPAGNTVVGIEYFDVAVPEVICVTIDETVINARTGKVLDATSVGGAIALQVNGGLYIEAIVFKIDEGNPFSET